MDTKSQQLMLDLWLDQEVEPLVPKICALIDANFTVLQKNHYPFTPQGETIVYVLSESHFALHTYPEVKYISMDIYVCNMSIDLVKVKEEIFKICQPIKMDEKIIHRGHGTGIK